MDELLEWLGSHGIDLVPVLDDKIHRFKAPGSHKNNRWYKGSDAFFHGKPIKTLTWGDNKTGEKYSFHSKANGQFNEQERAEYATEIEKRTRAAKEEKALEQERAAERAKRVWAAAGQASPSHPYLVKKRIEATSHIRQSGEMLLVPMYDITGRLWGLQRIFASGEKRYLKGQKKAGCFLRLSDKSCGAGTCIAEGLATGFSIHVATKLTTYVAFDSGNLELVARAIRGSDQDAQIVVCGDDDRWGVPGKNIGREKAIAAAKAVGGVVCFPEFQGSLEDMSYMESKGFPTDLNDLMILEGCDEVRRQIERAIATRDGSRTDGLHQSANATENRYTETDARAKSGLRQISSEDKSKSGRDPVGDGGNREGGAESIKKALVLPDKGSKGAIRGTIENIKALLNYLGIIARYNVISKEREILIPGEAFTVDNRANASLACVISECNKFGVPAGNLMDYLNKITDENLYNPVATWIESREWDGQSRLKDLYETIESRSPIKEILMRKWLISAVAAAYEPNGISAHGVLVFMGKQYIGKTKWFKNLAPQELGVLKDGAILHPDNKDSVFQVITKWLVELGELDATFRKSDIAQLKAFLTKDNDTLRRAYAKDESHYARRTVFFASVNEQSFLSDPTGNRRFWTIDCEFIDHAHKINMQQLWAEVRTLYLAKESWYLSIKENDELNKNNEAFYQVDPIEERIMDYYAWDRENVLVVKMNASAVCIQIGISNPTRRDVLSASRAIKRISGQSASRGRLYELPLFRGDPMDKLIKNPFKDQRQ